VNERNGTDFLVEERSDLLDEDFEISKPATLLLDLGDLLPQLLLLRCEFGSFVCEVLERGGVDGVGDFEGREGSCESGCDSGERWQGRSRWDCITVSVWTSGI
jgi:hypothetical protein